MEDSDVLEASTPYLDDVVRLRDDYGREGTQRHLISPGFSASALLCLSPFSVAPPSPCLCSRIWDWAEERVDRPSGGAIRRP